MKSSLSFVFYIVVLVFAQSTMTAAAPVFSGVDRDKFLASDGAANDYFGSSVAISGNYAIVGAYGNGGYSGSAYVFHRSGASWVQEAKLTAQDGAALDYFGCSVAISGNYAIVGAYGDNDNGSQSGSAYVFHRSGTSWTQEAKLTAQNGAAYDYFGCSVAISGNNAIVGAYGDDAKGSQSGSAYAFHRSGTSWTQEAKLTAQGGAAGDHFGFSVAISGDYAIVGADGDDDNGDGSGSAYVFQRFPQYNIWLQGYKLIAQDGAERDFFGSSVAISGNYAIVGSVQDDDRGRDSGSAYVFHRSGASWPQEAKLAAPDGAVYDYFGRSVAISGDYAIVGAYGDDDNGDYSGSAYVFHRSGTSWTQEAKLTAQDGAAGDDFGHSVAISGDYAIVGAHGDDDNGTASGSAYLYGVNYPPVANNDNSNTDENTPVNINVASNDTDANSDNLSVSTVDSVSANGAAVTMNGDGVSVDYDPTGAAAIQSLDEGATLDDTFTYTVADGFGGTDSATVTVSVTGVNDAPTANDDKASTDEETLLTVLAASGVLLNDVEVDTSDAITVTSFDALSGAGATVSVAADGSFTYDPRTSALLNALANGQQTIDFFTYTVTDGYGATDSATVRITVTGRADPPTDLTFSASSLEEHRAHGTVVGLLDAVDADVSDIHTFTLVAGTGDDDNDKFQIVGDELRTNHVFDSAVAATLSIRVQGDDGNGGIYTRIFVINVVAQELFPQADAGPDQLVLQDSEVTLHGGHSRGRTGGITSYNWVQLDGPVVTLSDATIANPTFQSPATTDTLEFQLTVTDESTNTAQDICYVNVDQGGLAPHSSAGSDQSIANSTTTTLDSSASYGWNSIAAYDWRQLLGPAVALSDTTSDIPALQSPVAYDSGVALVYELTITDDRGHKCANNCIVNVTTTNSAPASLAGDDQQANPGGTVTLDGSASTDIDGPTLSYQWKQLFGIPVTLNDTTIAAPQFTAPAIDPFGSPLLFELTVRDVSGLQSRDEVRITVTDVPVPDGGNGGTTGGGGGGGGGGCTFASQGNDPIILLLIVLPFTILVARRHRKAHPTLLKNQKWPTITLTKSHIEHR